MSNNSTLCTIVLCYVCVCINRSKTRSSPYTFSDLIYRYLWLIVSRVNRSKTRISPYTFSDLIYRYLWLIVSVSTGVKPGVPRTLSRISLQIPLAHCLLSICRSFPLYIKSDSSLNNSFLSSQIVVIRANSRYPYSTTFLTLSSDWGNQLSEHFNGGTQLYHLVFLLSLFEFVYMPIPYFDAS